MTYHDGSEATYETGTTTGLFQFDGSLTVDGAKTNELTGTTTTFDYGIGAIRTLGAAVGTFSYETTTAFGCELMVMY
jgi:hypothetical protein